MDNELNKKMEEVFEAAAHKLVNEEQLDGFMENLRKDLGSDGLEVSRETVTAFKSGLELALTADSSTDIMKAILACKRYLMDDDEEFFDQLEVDDPDE